MSATTKTRVSTVELVYVVHTYEGNTLDAPLSAAEAEARLAKLLADPEVTDARIERRQVKLTAAQRDSLDLVAGNIVTYRPGRTTGPRSGWTRYSYGVSIKGRYTTRTKSVDVLVELGLADLAGSASRASAVVLTKAGRDLLAAPAPAKAPKLSTVTLSDAQAKALRYWAFPASFPCYLGGNRATLASLVRRRLLDEPRGMMGHEINDDGLAALARFAGSVAS